MLVLLTSCYRVSRKKAADFAEQVCAVPCSAAHVSDLEGRTQSLIHPAYQELVDATIEKVTDIMEITGFGVMATPALAIDGEVKFVGKVATVDEIAALLE
ncbi:MAG: hypothetical protein CMJ46_07305 [Planctomyces sp.]|nr:hypothetical protein [Planctomyces sp.]